MNPVSSGIEASTAALIDQLSSQFGKRFFNSTPSEEYQQCAATTLGSYEALLDLFTDIVQLADSYSTTDAAMTLVRKVAEQEFGFDGSAYRNDLSHAMLFREVTAAVRTKTTGSQRSCPSALLRIKQATAGLVAAIGDDARNALTAIYIFETLHSEIMFGALRSCCDQLGIPVGSLAYFNPETHGNTAERAEQTLLALEAEIADNSTPFSQDSVTKIFAQMKVLVAAVFNVEIAMTATT